MKGTPLLERTATVRVRVPKKAASLPPSRTLLEKAATMLEDHGFSILRIGRRGVSVKADQSTYLREFGLALPAEGSVVREPVANRPLSGLIDLVEAAEAPISF